MNLVSLPLQRSRVARRWPRSELLPVPLSRRLTGGRQFGSGAPAQSMIGKSMKMTRNRKYGPYVALGWLAILAALLAPLAAAGPSRAQAPGGEIVSIELNKLEPQGEACRAYLVVKNSGEQGFDSLKLDLVMFDRTGVVAKRLAVQAAPLDRKSTRLNSSH